MSSESLNTSDEAVRGRGQERSTASEPPNPPYGNVAVKPSMFPLGYKEGFSQWWASIPAAVAEHRVLSFLPFLQQPPTQRQTGNTADAPTGATHTLETQDRSQEGDVSANSINDPYGPRRWRSTMVELSGQNRALNEFSVERVGEQADQNLVMLHGYGAGLGFFYKNFEPLSRPRGWHLYALDLLGMGRSTRPPFKIKAKDRQEANAEAEAWFVDALEEWRIKRGIKRFTLLGHSLGGYMAVAYALKYPGRVNKLILASPVGIPEDPHAVDADMPEPSESGLANEFTQDQESITGGQAGKTGDNNNFMNARAKAAQSAETAPRRRLPKWFAYLWDQNVSPFSIVRWTGPFGPRIVSAWTSRRFSHLPSEEAKALHDYAYSIFRLRGSGEYALTYVLAPGAFARNPLIRRIHGVGRQTIQPLPEDTTSSTNPSSTAQSTSNSPPEKRENGIPVVFMYGDHDWMDVRGGHAAKAKIEEEKRRILQNATPEERQADNASAKVVIIKKAGHHLYLDGADEFNQVVLEEMEDVSRKERQRNQ
ncbi:hypothetical protein Plec18170_004764 [Paecilomyces lecythidis]